MGIGEDGHTASLFPGHPEVEDSSGALCLPVRNSPKPPSERVTLSLSVLRAARCSLLLAAGAGKAEALAAVWRGAGGPGGWAGVLDSPPACSPPSACTSWPMPHARVGDGSIIQPSDGSAAGQAGDGAR